MTFNNTFTKLALAASFLFIPFSIIAEPTLEEVVVSARKVNENLQDVPIAMSVLKHIKNMLFFNQYFSYIQ